MKLFLLLTGLFLYIYTTAKPPYIIPDDLKTGRFKGKVASVREFHYDFLKDPKYSPEQLPPIDTWTLTLYNPEGFMTRCESYSATDTLPHTINTYLYDSTGRQMLSAITELTANHTIQTIEYIYDSLGRLAKENILPFGMPTLYLYDKKGYPIRCLSGNTQTSYRYNRHGQIRKEVTRITLREITYYQ